MSAGNDHASTERREARGSTTRSFETLYRYQVDAVCCLKESCEVIAHSDAIAEKINDGKSLERTNLKDFLVEPNDFTKALKERQHPDGRPHPTTVSVSFLNRGTGKIPTAALASIRWISAEDCFSCSFTFPTYSTPTEELIDSSKTLKAKALDAMPYAMHAMTLDSAISVSNSAADALFQSESVRLLPSMV